MRNRKKKKVTIRDVAMLYGQRPHDDPIWYLSPYEFVTYWEPQLLSYPTTLEDAENPAHHAKLTDAGTLKLQEAVRNKCDADLLPGEDYVVKEKSHREDEEDDTWLAFPAGPDTEHFRHTWILRRRRRPRAPSCGSAGAAPSTRGSGTRSSDRHVLLSSLDLAS